MKRQKSSRILSVLLCLALMLGALPATLLASAANVNTGDSPAFIEVGSKNVKELPEVKGVETVALGLLESDIPTSIDASAFIKATGAAPVSEEQAYIEAVAEMLATPVGLIGLEAVGADEVIDVIVWLQEMPKALVEAYGEQSIPNVESFAGASARKTINALGKSTAYEVKFEYSEVFSGFALSATKADLEVLAQMPGIFAINPDTLMYADEYTPDPDYNFIGMSESREALRIGEIHEAGYTGAGVIVGVLDSGIDYDHPDFKDVYKGGWNFITASADHNTRNRPANDPMETTYDHWQRSGQVETNAQGSTYYTSHGTHVSGTIAAQAVNGDSNYRALGMAPEVDLYVARVLGAYGSGATSGIIAAVEDFAADGGNLPKADVINLSLGSNNDTAYGDNIFALNNAVIAGVNVVCSAGNNGGDNASGSDRRLYTLGSPGTAYLATTVAASQYGGTAVRTYDEVTATGGASSDTLGLLVEGYDANDLFYDNLIVGSNVPVYVEGKGYEAYLAFGANDTNPTLEQLQAIPDGSLAGKILVVKRGLAFTDFYAQAIRAGASGLVIVNSATYGNQYVTNMTIGGPKINGIPLFSAFHSTSAKLTALAAGGNTVYLELGTLNVQQHALLPSYYSSIGPVTETVGLKPDVIAPGWNIISTQPSYLIDPEHRMDQFDGAYGSKGGTSMSAPHVAGIMALLKQRFPEATPAELKARLMNTSDPYFIMAMEDGTSASVLEVGAGFVDPYRAIISDTDVFVTVADHIPGRTSGTWIEGQTLSSLSFGNMLSGEISRVLPVTVHGAEEFDISVFYNDNTRYSLSCVDNGVQLMTGPVADGTFDTWVEVPLEAEGGLYEGYLIITVGDSEFVVPWIILIGEADQPFEASYILSGRPIISTTTDTSKRASSYANATTLFVQYSGTSWPGGSSSIVLLSEDLSQIKYFYGNLNTASLVAGTMYNVTGVIASQAYPVGSDGSLGTTKVTIEDGAYYVAMSAGTSYWYDSGVVFTSGVPTLTVDEFIELDPEEDDVVRVTGNIYSEAAALANELGFTWDDPDYVMEGYRFLVDQSWNALAVPNASGVAAFLTAGGSAWICDEDGNFEVFFASTEQSRQAWDYLITYTNGSHELVGVDAYDYNYVSILGIINTWVQHGNAKSAPVTITYGVLPELESLTLENGKVSAFLSHTWEAAADVNKYEMVLTVNGAPINDAAFAFENGVATWTFAPVDRLEDLNFAVAVTFAGKTLEETLFVPRWLEATKVSINLSALTSVQRGATFQLEAISDVAGAFTDGPTTITWTSSNPNIVRIDENGMMTAAGTGMAVITVKVVTPFRTLTASVTVRVS